MSIVKNNIKGVTMYNKAKAYNGYTLVAPEGGYNAWLIDMNGDIVFHWPLKYQPCPFARLLPNGNLIYQGGEEENQRGPVIDVKDSNGETVLRMVLGGGEHIIELDSDYNVVWEYHDPYLTHDFYRMETGNTMMIKYAKVPDELKSKIKGGIHIAPDTPMWCDMLIEVNPKGEIVWEWLSYEHLDFETDVYCPLEHRCEWTHMNTCTVLPNGDVLGSFRTIDLICIIDRQSGKVKWKWGPGEIAHQHEPTLLDNGNILVFDNGEHRRFSKYAYSRVIEVNPKTNKIEWEYKGDPPYSFYSGNQSGCQWLPNGNVLITNTMSGQIFEVTHEKEKVWEYMSPFYGPHQGQLPNPLIYRSYRYGTDYPGLKGKELNAEKYFWINEIYGRKV